MTAGSCGLQLLRTSHDIAGNVFLDRSPPECLDDGSCCDFHYVKGSWSPMMHILMMGHHEAVQHKNHFSRLLLAMHILSAGRGPADHFWNGSHNALERRQRPFPIID